MCNLIRSDVAVDVVAAHFKARRKKPTNAGPGEVWKGDIGFVVRHDAGERVLEAMHWGFPFRPANMKPTSKPLAVNNARDDKLLAPKGLWRPWFLDPAHRCLIPITAFCEAVGEKGQMTRAWISIADQPIAACAGIWRPTDEFGNCHSMVMVDATDERMLAIHDRMPVILHPGDYDAWLSAPADAAMALVTQYPADRLLVDRTAEPWTAPRPPKPNAQPGLI